MKKPHDEDPQALQFEQNWNAILQLSQEYGKITCRICHRNISDDEISSSNPHLCRRCDFYR